MGRHEILEAGSSHALSGTTSDARIQQAAERETDLAAEIGLREGFGRFIAKDRKNPRNYEYKGQWLDNLRHGTGRCYFYNGDLYEGEWLRGKRHGKGTAFLQTGERYVGMWEADRRHGYGTLSRADGTRYVGMFVHDLKHGRGQLFFPNGTVQEEDWNHGQ